MLSARFRKGATAAVLSAMTSLLSTTNAAAQGTSTEETADLRLPILRDLGPGEKHWQLSLLPIVYSDRVDNYNVIRSVGRFRSLLNNVQVGLTETDDTANARENLLFDAERAGVVFCGVLSRPVHNNLFIWTTACGNAGRDRFGTTDAGGNVIIRSGNGLGFEGSVGTAIRIFNPGDRWQHQLSMSFALSVYKAGALDPKPAAAVTNGTLLSDFTDLESSNLKVNAQITRANSAVSMYLGVEHLSSDVTLNRHAVVDRSQVQAGARQELDATTELDKPTTRVVAGGARRLSATFSIVGDAAFGTESRTLTVGGIWKIK